MAIERSKKLRQDPKLIERLIADAATHEEIRWLADQVAGIPDEAEADSDYLEPVLSDAQRDLVAAALMAACREVPVQLLEDVGEQVTRADLGEARDIETTSVLSMLPPRYWDRFDLVFARRFVGAMDAVVGQLLGSWSGPRCIAEELCLNILFSVAAFRLDVWGADFELSVSLLIEVTLEDSDFQDLYADRSPLEHPEVADALGVAPMGFEDWFVPFRDEEPVNY